MLNLPFLLLLCNRTWKRVVVEGGVGPEPAGPLGGEEGQEEPAAGDSQAAAPRRRTRSQQVQPSFHAEAVETGDA